MSKSLRILKVNSKEDLKTLRAISREVTQEEIKSDEFQEFLDNLLYTVENTDMQEGFMAAGLAAPQVGKNIRVFAKLIGKNKFGIYINPKIDILKTTQDIQLEACLSIPDKEGLVLRFNNIKLTYLDRKGRKRREKYYDWDAREILHENDHLDGILFTDKLVD
jgi:peptide deformylase